MDDEKEWLDLVEAGALLGKGEKTVRKLSKSEAWKWKYAERTPGSNAALRKLFLAADVRAHLAKAQPAIDPDTGAVVAETPERRENNGKGNGKPSSVVIAGDAMRELIQAFAPALKPVENVYEFHEIKRKTELRGLASRELKQLCKAGTLRHVLVGPPSGKRYKVRLVDIDAMRCSAAMEYAPSL